jgi:transposase
METEDDTAYWQEIGSIYGGVKQRWIVVYHRGTAKKDARAFERRLEKQRISAEKALHRLSCREFGCRDAVTKALDELTNSWRYHSAQIECYQEPRYDRPGRPGPDAQPRYVWKFTGQVVEDEDAIATARAAHGKYVLATNELDDRAFPAPTLLNMYKDQSTTVERGFRFLKDPLFFADSFFLNKPSRIMALLMVMGLSLLVYSLAERHLRQQLADHNEFIPDQKGKPTQRPTARRVFQMFEGIHVLLIQQNGHQQRLIVNLTALHHQMLNLFSKQVQDIYHLRL